MKAHFAYLEYLLRHKWEVFKRCYKRGIIWRGITHDLSKFLPDEWFPYVHFFYDKDGNLNEPIEIWNKLRLAKTGDEKFDIARLKHQHRNKHHWQWWTSVSDETRVVAYNIPLKYKKEMVSDWEGAGTIQGVNTQNWYLKNRNTIVLHKEVSVWLENELGIPEKDRDFKLLEIRRLRCKE